MIWMFRIMEVEVVMRKIWVRGKEEINKYKFIEYFLYIIWYKSLDLNFGKIYCIEIEL